jgi:hypothetical protein
MQHGKPSPTAMCIIDSVVANLPIRAAREKNFGLCCGKWYKRRLVFAPFRALIAIAVLVAVQRAAAFAVYDAIAAYKRGKPDLVIKNGLKRIRMVYGSELWGERPRVNGVPQFPETPSADDERRIRALAQKIHAEDPESLVCVDIEHWRLTGTDEEARESTRKLLLVLAWFREEAPSLKIGYYGTAPVVDYHLADATAGAQRFQLWLNRTSHAQKVGEAVDAIFPSLYTFRESTQFWDRFAQMTITEARRFRKPVYAFLWPEFYVTEPNRCEFLPAALWRRELDWCAANTDGAVLWASASLGCGGQPWNSSWGWWQTTVNFLNTRRSASSPEATH